MYPIRLHRVFSQRRQLGFSMVDYIGMDLLVHEKETSADLFIKRNLRYRAWRFAGEGNANSGSQGILVVLGTNKRQRTAWACYSWDKQLAAICGKPPLLRIWDHDVSLPEVFEETELTSTEHPENQDEKLCAIFIQQILLSVVLEKTLTSCTHHPEFDNCEMLNRWARSMRLEVEDTKALDDSTRLLTEWREWVQQRCLLEYARVLI